MREPTYAITWHVTPRQDVEIVANVIAGLAILAAEEEITFRVAPGDIELESRHTMLLSVKRVSDGSSRLAAIDVLDRADAFDYRALSVSAVYFKCNFQPRHIPQVPGHVSNRLRPLGLAQLCVVNGSAPIFLRAGVSALRAGMRREGVRSLRTGLKAAARNLTLLRGANDLSSLHSRQSAGSDSPVIFQPRGWAETSAANVRANRSREDVVRQLRAQFGDTERIGFIRAHVKNSVSEDLYITRKVARREYLEMLNSTAIGVNCHGLNDSSTFKLSEYLAAGMAIVSDQMKFVLPEPLVEGVNYLKYESPEECVERCRELISSPDRLQAMRAANREYFSRNLEPATQVRYLLRETFDDQEVKQR